MVKGSMQQEELTILNVYMQPIQEHPDSKIKFLQGLGLPHSNRGRLLYPTVNIRPINQTEN